jgi:hypothetical protein
MSQAKTMNMRFAAVLLASCLAWGCGETPQEKAYDQALQTEGEFANTPGQAAPMLIDQYEKVVDMDSGSKCAERARKRIEMLRTIRKDYENSQGAR